MNCHKCELGKYSNPVWGIGDVDCGLFIVGQNPGINEVIENKPFVGDSGQVLDAILKYVKINRNNIFITNICKCFSPQNRKPTNNEILNCTKYLEEEIREGNPKVIIALGSVSINYFTGISNVENAREKKYIKPIERNLVIIPSYHPAYYLRNGKSKEILKYMVNDFIFAKRVFDRIKNI